MKLTRRECAAILGAAAVQAADNKDSTYSAVPLIPREVLFSDPEKAAPRRFLRQT